jgi:hypothetical protein
MADLARRSIAEGVSQSTRAIAQTAYPGNALSEATANDWPGDGSNRPGQSDDSDEFAPLLQIKQVRHENVREHNYAASPDSLETATSKESGNIVSESTNEGSDCEESKGNEEGHLTTKGCDRSEDGLEDSRAEDKGCASPIYCGDSGIEFLGYNLLPSISRCTAENCDV